MRKNLMAYMTNLQFHTFPQTTAPLDKTATQCYIVASMTRGDVTGGGRGGTGDSPMKRHNYVEQQIK